MLSAPSLSLKHTIGPVLQVEGMSHRAQSTKLGVTRPCGTRGGVGIPARVSNTLHQGVCVWRGGNKTSVHEQYVHDLLSIPTMFCSGILLLLWHCNEVKMILFVLVFGGVRPPHPLFFPQTHTIWQHVSSDKNIWRLSVFTYAQMIRVWFNAIDVKATGNVLFL